MAESPSASEQNPDSAESQRTGGVNIGADQANIGGDVVGRDQTTTIDTGGGVYVGRDVTIEGQGKLIGRDDNSINVSGSPGAIVGRDVTVIRQGHVGKRFWMTVALIAGMIVIGLGVAVAALTQLPPMPDGFNIAILNSSSKMLTGV